jgi:hypothetical protein
VIDSQGGGQIKDLASVQRGGPMLKLWTNFYSIFNVTFNQGSRARGGPTSATRSRSAGWRSTTCC